MSEPPHNAVKTAVAPSGRRDILATLLKASLSKSLTDGGFDNVCFVIYSRRLTSGQLGKPQVLHANKDVLTATAPYFKSLLDGGFAEGSTTGKQRECPILSKAPADIASDDDSDLEDEDEVGEGPSGGSMGTDTPVSALTTPPHSPKLSEDDELQGTHPDAPAGETVTVDCDTTPVVIKDGAYATWRSLLYFIYTGEIAFAPLRSSGVAARRLAISNYHNSYSDRPPPCSHKSIYRLADITDMSDLKSLALSNLESQLTPANITCELFSRLSSCYPEVLQLKTAYLDANRSNATIEASMIDMMGRIVQGQLPHALPALSEMYRICVRGPLYPQSSSKVPVLGAFSGPRPFTIGDSGAGSTPSSVFGDVGDSSRLPSGFPYCGASISPPSSSSKKKKAGMCQ